MCIRLRRNFRFDERKMWFCLTPPCEQQAFDQMCEKFMNLIKTTTLSCCSATTKKKKRTWRRDKKWNSRHKHPQPFPRITSGSRTENKSAADVLSISLPQKNSKAGKRMGVPTAFKLVLLGYVSILHAFPLFIFFLLCVCVSLVSPGVSPL